MQRLYIPKTIESVLEPVAQQVSKLVILHEETDDDHEMPDISYPVQAVKKAADNLIKVGYETCATSDDLVLRKEMQPALQRVEEACNALQQAALILKREPKSTMGKRNLIVGERVILLRFDESEVRKIIRVCSQVVEYLAITEVIEKMDSLVAYVKNLTPILTKMTREIENREKELTHQIHREMLCQHLDQLKSLMPSFISSIKISLLIDSPQNELGEQVHARVRKNKDYLISNLTDEVNEIIRILQLTVYDEDEWMCDDVTAMRQKINNFEIKLKTAYDWLADPNRLVGGVGEKAVRNSLYDSITFSDKLLNDKQSTVRHYSTNIKKHLDVLCSLIQENKHHNQLAIDTATSLSNELQQLHAEMKSITQMAATKGIDRLASSIYGKFEQIKKWLLSPQFSFTISGLGEQATKFVIQECRALAIGHCKDIVDRENFLQEAYDAELLLSQLMNKLKQIKMANKSFSSKDVDFAMVNMRRELGGKMAVLEKKIIQCVIKKVADNFIDVNLPLKKLGEVLVCNKDYSSDLLTRYEVASIEFLGHSQKMCSIAQELAGCIHQSRNKKSIDCINELTKRIVEFSPHVVDAAFILLHTDRMSSVAEHFDLIQSQWEFMMDRLQKLVDESLNTELFICACEQSIFEEIYLTYMAVNENDNKVIVAKGLSIIRRSNRVWQVANLEAENFEEEEFVKRILIENEKLKKCLPIMIKCTKQLAFQPDNKDFFKEWTNSNKQLTDAIARVRDAVSMDVTIDDVSISSASHSIYNESDTSGLASYCNLSELNLTQSEDIQSSAPVSPENSRHFLKGSYASRPTPLPDLIEENETDFPQPHPNQPILMAAHDLHTNISQWYSNDNHLLIVAKRITHLMVKLSELVVGEIGTKKELVATAKKLADESMEVARIAKLLAADCTDKRIRTNLLQVSERIPTIGTQLKILSTVKATMLSNFALDTKENEEATDMLIVNSQNLNLSVKATVEAAKTARIKLRTESGLRMKWVRKRNK